MGTLSPLNGLFAHNLEFKMTKHYQCHYERRSIIVEAPTTFLAKMRAAQKLGIRESKAHYIVARSLGYNKSKDRYTSAYGFQGAQA